MDERNNTRVIMDDAPTSAYLFEKIKKHLHHCPNGVGRYHDDRYEDTYLFGLNTRLRFYRYRDGQQFKVHTDGAYGTIPYVHSNNAVVKDRSFFTVLFYLNSVSDQDGGSTTFFTDKVFQCMESQ